MSEKEYDIENGDEEDEIYDNLDSETGIASESKETDLEGKE